MSRLLLALPAAVSAGCCTYTAAITAGISDCCLLRCVPLSLSHHHQRVVVGWVSCATLSVMLAAVLLAAVTAECSTGLVVSELSLLLAAVTADIGHCCLCVCGGGGVTPLTLSHHQRVVVGWVSCATSSSSPTATCGYASGAGCRQGGTQTGEHARAYARTQAGGKRKEVSKGRAQPHEEHPTARHDVLQRNAQHQSETQW
jgi:hypothetical protein